MRASELGRQWSTPNNNELTIKQYSLRLPVHVAAKIEAIAEMFPNRNRTEIMGDLLSAALTDFEAGLYVEGDVEDVIERGGERVVVRQDLGRTKEFRDLTQKHIQLIRQQSSAKAK